MNPQTFKNQNSSNNNQTFTNNGEIYTDEHPSSKNGIERSDSLNYNNPVNHINNYRDQDKFENTFTPVPNKPLPLKITYDRSLGTRGRMIVFACILSLLASFAFGFFLQKDKVQDDNKRNDLFYVIRALNSYYEDSSEFIEQRKYPLSTCLGQLNSFDYEYTLRKALTGTGLNSSGHAYIASEFPSDKLGKYTGAFADYPGMNSKNAGKTVAELGMPNCFNALPIFERDNFTTKYFDNYKICKHDNKIEPFKLDFFAQKNCYLYTSTKNGDSYRLAYYSNSLNKYVVYSQYRNSNLSVVYSN